MNLNRNLLYLCIATLCGCTTSKNTYDPAIIEHGVDMQKFKIDRTECERTVNETPSNLESTNSTKFRKCLIEKGYKLMS
jgi:hypothetical protein